MSPTKYTLQDPAQPDAPSAEVSVDVAADGITLVAGNMHLIFEVTEGRANVEIMHCDLDGNVDLDTVVHVNAGPGGIEVD